MQAKSDTLDGLLRAVLTSLIDQEELIKAHRGDFKEVFGACLHLTNPLARLSRSESKGRIYSALGEFLWYLSGDIRLDFIDYYVPRRFQEESDDQITVRSGYPTSPQSTSCSGSRWVTYGGSSASVANLDALRRPATARKSASSSISFTACR